MLGQSQTGEGISVVGEATSVAVPDTIELTIAIKAAGPTVTQALREHANRTVSLMQTLTSKAVASNDVRTTGVTVVPLLAPSLQALAPSLQVYVGVPPTLMPGGYGDVPPSGYQAGSSVIVSIHDVNRLAELLDAVVAAGPHLTMALRQKVTDEAAVRRSVLESALKDARLKAQTIAASMGKQLSDPLNVVEGANAPMNGSGQADGSFGPSLHVPALPLPAELAVHVTVRVTYGVR